MNIREDVERDVWKALNDPEKCELYIGFVKRKTSVTIWAGGPGDRVRAIGETTCAPTDAYDQRIEYDLALGRAIKDAIGKLLAKRTDIRCEDECYDWTHGNGCLGRCSASPPEQHGEKHPIGYIAGNVWYSHDIASNPPWTADALGRVFGVDLRVPAKPPMPQRRRAAVVSGNTLWCDDEIADAIRAIDGVISVGRPGKTTGRRPIYFDPRFDAEDIIAVIEAIGATE